MYQKNHTSCFYLICFFVLFTLIGYYVETKLEIPFRGTHLANTRFVVYLKDIYRHTTTKSSQERKMLDTEKTGDL